MAATFTISRVLPRCGACLQAGLISRLHSSAFSGALQPRFALLPTSIIHRDRSVQPPPASLTFKVCQFSTAGHDNPVTPPGGDQKAHDDSVAPPGGDQQAMENRIKHNLEQIRERHFEEEIADPEQLKHFRLKGPSSPKAHDINSPIWPSTAVPPIGTHALPHRIWSEKELHSVRITHKEPERLVDRMAYGAVQLLRGSYDFISGYNRKDRDTKLWVNRVCFLETVAGVPGMVAAMVRHLDSLRKMRRDHGWIHTLLEEAENERMHLMVALQLKQPGFLFRATVITAQALFVTMFSFSYMISPRFCHRLVGYLEEEAVKTYSKLLKDMESGPMSHWNTKPAPEIAVGYWQLKSDATMKDVILAIRADEAHHRVVNHTLGSMRPNDYNPYKPGH